MDLAEALLPEGIGWDPVLERIDALVDWSALEAVCKEIYAAPVGRPGDPQRVLIKAPLVQAWWDLLHPKAEQLLLNDLGFRRFLRVGLVDRTPDHNTLRRFRDQLVE
jgi:hypothetical protein